MSGEARFRELLAVASYPLSVEQVGQLFQHFALLQKWNKTINLTTVDRLEEAVVKHYAESLALAVSIPAGTSTILDIGSGGGFPGIPVAVLHPDAKVFLCESDRRKAAFLREATDFVPNARIAAQRAESIQQRCDWVIARAVRPEEVLKVALRLASHVGLIVSSADANQLRLDGRLLNTHTVNLPAGSEGSIFLADVPRGT